VPARPRAAYWIRNAIRANIAPMKSRFHPTALRLREAIRAPTVAYPRPAAAMNTLSNSSPLAMGVAPELIHTRRQPAAPSRALMPHTGQASRDAVRSFIACSSPRVLLNRARRHLVDPPDSDCALPGTFREGGYPHIEGGFPPVPAGCFPPARSVAPAYG
jgi:hypothetical protein